jgi:hypothetical protein
MAVINQRQSERQSYADERRRKEAEEAAENELERTLKAADEHRQAVAGDAKPEGRDQRVAPRHEKGAQLDSLMRTDEQRTGQSGRRRRSSE